MASTQNMEICILKAKLETAATRSRRVLMAAATDNDTSKVTQWQTCSPLGCVNILVILFFDDFWYASSFIGFGRTNPYTRSLLDAYPCFQGTSVRIGLLQPILRILKTLLTEGSNKSCGHRSPSPYPNFGVGGEICNISLGKSMQLVSTDNTSSL